MHKLSHRDAPVRCIDIFQIPGQRFVPGPCEPNAGSAATKTKRGSVRLACHEVRTEIAEESTERDRRWKIFFRFFRIAQISATSEVHENCVFSMPSRGDFSMKTTGHHKNPAAALLQHRELRVFFCVSRASSVYVCRPEDWTSSPLKASEDSRRSSLLPFRLLLFVLLLGPMLIMRVDDERTKKESERPSSSQSLAGAESLGDP